MFKIRISIFNALLVLFLVAPVRAEVSEIKLLVNGQPISNFDIEQQARLLMATSNIQLTRENFKRARARGRDQLIENVLRREEAQKNGITVDDAEIQKAIQSGLPKGQSIDSFIRFLKKNKVHASSLHKHISADLLWNKFVESRIIPRIIVAQNQVEQRLNETRESLQQKNYLLSQIVLRFENQKMETRAKNLAAQLQQQLHEGASFDSLARNFSTGRHAAQGGDQGWVPENALPIMIRRVVKDMKKGTLSPVIRLANGYHMMLLRDVREADENRLVRVSVDIKILHVAARADEAARIRRQVQRNFPGCAQASAYAASIGSTLNDMGFVPISDLSQTLRNRLKSAKQDSIIPSVLNNGTQEFIALCGKRTEANQQLSRRRIESQILSEQAFMRARQKLRDLRLDANIEQK